MPAETDVDTQQREIIRVGIDGLWVATEFAEFLADLARLHEVAFVVWQEPDPRLFRPSEIVVPQGQALHYPGYWPRRRSLVERTSEARVALQVVRINYASPGFADLAGLGKAVEQVRLFLEHIIDLDTYRRRRELEDEKLEQEVFAMKIDNVHKVVTLTESLRQAGVGFTDLRDLFIEVEDVQERLLQKVADGKLTEVRELGAADEESD